MTIAAMRRHVNSPATLFLFAAGLFAVPVFASTVRIYVTNSAGDSVDVVDPATNKIVQAIKGIEVPHGVNFSPDGKRVYVTNESKSELEIIDRVSAKIIKSVPLTGRPNNIAVSKDGKLIFICISEKAGALDIVDTVAMEKVNSLPMKAALHNVFMTPDGKYAVAGSVAGKFMVVVDAATQKVAWELPFDKGVRPMAFDANPDGSTNRAFVQISGLDGFVVVDFATHKEITRVKHPDEHTGFGLAEQRAGAPSHGIGVAPDGKSLWVNSVYANAVFAYSLPDLKLIGRAELPSLEVSGRHAVGSVPDWLTFTPDSKTVYVADSGLRSVSAIDAKTMKEVARIRVGEVPKRMNTFVIP